MNTKKIILLFSIILIVTVSSLAMASAGWFDFGSYDAADNPISAPSNAQKIKLKQSGLDRLDIKYGEAMHTEKAHTTDWSGKEKYDYLTMGGSFRVDFDKLPKNAKPAMKKLHDTIFNESDYVNQDNAGEITYLTNPSNETGGMYFKLFDKNNKTILTKNILVTSDLIGEDSITQDMGSNNCYVMMNGKLLDAESDRNDSFLVDFEWFSDVTDNPELLKTVKNAKSGEIHMLVFDEGNAGDCYDIYIPVKHVSVGEDENSISILY